MAHSLLTEEEGYQLELGKLLADVSTECSSRHLGEV